MHHLHHNLISQEIYGKVFTSCGSTPKSLQNFSPPSPPIVSGSSWPLSKQKNKKFDLITLLYNYVETNTDVLLNYVEQALNNNSLRRHELTGSE